MALTGGTQPSRGLPGHFHLNRVAFHPALSPWSHQRQVQSRSRAAALPSRIGVADRGHSLALGSGETQNETLSSFMLHQPNQVHQLGGKSQCSLLAPHAPEMGSPHAPVTNTGLRNSGPEDWGCSASPPMTPEHRIALRLAQPALLSHHCLTQPRDNRGRTSNSMRHKRTGSSFFLSQPYFHLISRVSAPARAWDGLEGPAAKVMLLHLAGTDPPAPKYTPQGSTEPVQGPAKRRFALKHLFGGNYRSQVHTQQPF